MGNFFCWISGHMILPSSFCWIHSDFKWHHMPCSELHKELWLQPVMVQNSFMISLILNQKTMVVWISTIPVSRVKNNDWQVLGWMADHFCKWLAIWFASMKDNSWSDLTSSESLSVKKNLVTFSEKKFWSQQTAIVAGHNGQPLGQMVGHFSNYVRKTARGHMLF